jgi:hypothetical protein
MGRDFSNMHEDSLLQLATHCIAARVERSIHQWSTGGTGRLVACGLVVGHRGSHASVRQGPKALLKKIDRSGGFKWQRKLKREPPGQ